MRVGKNLFWSAKNSGEVLDGLRPGDFGAAGLSACGFSALCAALPRSLIKDKLVDFIGGAFRRGKGSLALRVVAEVHFLLRRGLKSVVRGRVGVYVMR